MIEILIAILILAGAFLTLLSAIGLIRLRDVYSRAHAAGKSSTLGVMFIMTGVFLFFFLQNTINAKILLAILFIFMTAPVSALMINRTAYKTGVPLDDRTVRDDLKGKYDIKETENNLKNES